MMEYKKNGSSEEIMKMDMECERKTTFNKGRPCSRKTAIFVLLGTVCMIIFMTMNSVILSHQQRTFSELESWMNLHSSNRTSVKPDLQITERQQGLSHTEVKSLMNSLNSAVSALTSKLNDAVGNQEQKQKQCDFESLSSSMSDLKSLVSDLSSSVSSLSSQLSVIIQDDSQTEVKSLMNSLSSAVSVLTAQLNDAESLSRSLSALKDSVSDLTSSVASLSSKQQTSEERVMNALKDLISNMSHKTANVPVTCKSGWISYKTSCFLFSSNTLSWTEARDYCKTQGALLLKIQDDDREWAFLNNHTIPTNYWVGLTDQNTGQWRWVDDTPYTMNKE